jgi:hypothetical protein
MLDISVGVSADHDAVELEHTVATVSSLHGTGLAVATTISIALLLAAIGILLLAAVWVVLAVAPLVVIPQALVLGKTGSVPYIHTFKVSQVHSHS